MNPTSRVVVDWSLLAARARLAPTPHNAQPFRLRIRADDSGDVDGGSVVDVVVDTDRLLVEEDRDNRYVAASVGIFIRTLEVAARAQGVTLQTQHHNLDYAALRNGQGLIDVAEVRAVSSCAVIADGILDRRQTNRLAYDGSAISDDDRRAIAAVVASAGHRIEFIDDAALVQQVMALNATAIIDNLQLDNERQELWHWTRLGRAPVIGDGLYGEALQQPDWELLAAFLLPQLFAWSPVKKLAVDRHVAGNGDVRTLAILRGPFSDDEAAIAAGKTLMDFWLALAERGIASQPFGSPMTNLDRRKDLMRLLGIVDDDVWFLVRLGHAALPPRAPHLSSIVLEQP